MEFKIPNKDDRSFATIDFNVKRSQLETMEPIYSAPHMIRQLPWKILVKKRYENQSNNLGFFVQCNGESESPSWRCFARVTLYVISQRSGIGDFSRKIAHVFHSKLNDWGYTRFMSWNEIINPAYGYVKDDTIILRAEITAYPPIGVDEKISNSRKENLCMAIDEIADSDEEMNDDVLISKCKQKETEIQSLKAELLQLKKELGNVKSYSKTLFEELNAKLQSKLGEVEDEKSNNISNQTGKEKTVGADVSSTV